MRLLGGLPRPARGEAQPALARRPSDPGLRASGRGWARGLAPLQAPTRAGVRGERRVNFCRLGGCGRVCVGVRGCGRALAARQPSTLWPAPRGPQLRVQRQPAVFVQLRSSRAAPAHPGSASAGQPSPPAGPAVAAAAQEHCCSSSASAKRGVRRDWLA